jgi:L-ascorbate metabolism protein UlaG (beta-lactamase superfamily)
VVLHEPAAVERPERTGVPISITWTGHATVLIEVDGVRILTDPAVTRRLAHLRRRVPAPTIDAVDVVLISHVHMDHLHLPSLRRVVGGARVIAPEGAGRLVQQLGVPTAEVRAGSRVLVPTTTSDPDVQVEVEVVPAHHFRRRLPHSRIEASPVGYVVHVGRRAVYFAGDTDLFDGMHELGPLDVALLPIWGWGPTLGERHLDPERAAIATEWIDPRTVVPIHWGTYSPVRARPGSPPWLAHPLAEFRAALGTRQLEGRLLALQPGGSLTLDG